ncbi:MAG: transposase [Lentisphaerota bacterium]
MALQLVHEAALCVTGIRQARSLSQKGFEVLNGLSFVASDQAMHDLLEAHTVTEAEALQVELGMLRRARGHFQGKTLAIDPHRIRSYSLRQMRLFREDGTAKPFKALQTFFCLDVDTHQPLCFTSQSLALSVSQATPNLLRLAQAILNPAPKTTLVLADAEHYSTALIDHVAGETPFDLLVPMPTGKRAQDLKMIPPGEFTPRWAGYATAKKSYHIDKSLTGPQVQFIQRSGETPKTYVFRAFLCTRDGDEVEELTRCYPKRWHVEEFFNAHQALGWHRAGTMNLNIRYGQMTMALLAQAVIHQFRQRLGEPCLSWDAEHLARSIFSGIDGDVRIQQDTILVTLYNAPQPDLLRQHYENLPEKLAAEHVDPRMPWLFNFKLDFQFK